MIIDNIHLMNRKFHDLWPYVLVHFHDSYPLPLRLVVISMLIVCDTSECERIFSLMNDIKTAERSSMGTRTLRNLMLWHRMARKVNRHPSSSLHSVLRPPPPCLTALVLATHRLQRTGHWRRLTSNAAMCQ